MKKLILLSVIVYMLSACNTNAEITTVKVSEVASTTTSAASESERETMATTAREIETTEVALTTEIPASITASEIIEALKISGLNILEIDVYDEVSDPNGLLGRPGGYIAKANFSTANDKNPEEKENTIEIFASDEDATSREEYIASIFDAMPLVRQYIYKEGIYLLRIDYGILPAEAKKYEEVFRNLVGN